MAAPPGPTDDGCATFPRWRVSSLLYAVSLLAASMALWGTAAGVLAAAGMLGVWAAIFSAPNPPRAMVTFLRLLLLVLFVAFLVELLRPRVGRPRGTIVPKPSCMNSMRMLGLAILNYEIVNRTLPPAYVADENGRPMHSWRVLILPYIDRQDLYEMYDFNEPWDGPNNSKLLRLMPEEFGCASRPKTHAGICHYTAIVGPQTVWTGAMPTPMSAITDGSRNTILLTEHPTGMPWTQPVDLSAEEFLDLARQDALGIDHVYVTDYFLFAESRTRPHSMMAMVDIHTHPLVGGEDAAMLSAMLTKAGGESLTKTQPQGSRRLTKSVQTRRYIYIKWGTVISLMFFVVLGVLPARSCKR